MKQFNLHLISDSSGQTAQNVSKAALMQFSDVKANKYIWPMIRYQTQLEEVFIGLEKNPGIVLYTIADRNIRNQLKQFCLQKRIPCISIIGKLIKEMTAYIGVSSDSEIIDHHIMDEDYFEKVNAIDFALRHDDGQSTNNLNEADIILVGASRTSKSPTCVYLSYNGYKAANVPFIYGQALPDNLFTLTKPLIVGLTINPERLVEIRQNRIMSLNQDNRSSYVDFNKVQEECAYAKRLFGQNSWPVIDVTHRSIEETSACIIKIYCERKRNQLKKVSI